MDPSVDRSEQFLRFSRQKMIALLFVVLVVGAIGLSLMLITVRPIWRTVSRASLIPVAIAVVVIVQMSLRGRRWTPDTPEVKVAMKDEWLRANMDRASRLALITVLLAQWPLSLILAFGMRVPSPRAQMAMAMATITLGLATQIGLFLFFDRE